MEYDQAFGSVFRALRLHKGLTQEAFQPRVTERYIRNIEKGEYSPSISLVRDLCDKLGVSPITLMALVEARYVDQDFDELMKLSTTETRDINKNL